MTGIRAHALRRVDYGPYMVTGALVIRYGVAFVALIALLLLGGRVSGSPTFLALTGLLALYNTGLVILVRGGKRETAFRLSEALDIVFPITAIFLLARSDQPGDMNLEIMEAITVIALPLGTLYFGVVVGGVLATFTIGVYLASYILAAGSPEGAATGAIHAAGAAVLAVIVGWLAYSLRHEQELSQAREREVAGLNRLYREQLGPRLEQLENERRSRE